MAIDPNWKMLEEIDFVRLAKLRLDVDEPDTVYFIIFFLYPCPQLTMGTVTLMAACSRGTRLMTG